MYNYIFGCNDVFVNVETNNKDLLNDLRHLYGEYYCDKGDYNLTIRYLECKENLSEKDINYQIKDRETSKETFNYINYNSGVLTIRFDYYNSDKLEFMQRILINTFIMELQRNGYVIIHGSCVSKDNHAFIISGNKGAGKTTTMLNLMQRGYDFVSNDKVALKKCNNQIIACGIPHSMGILEKDISKYNIDTRKAKKEGKIYFKVSDIQDVFGTNVCNKVILEGFVFPKYIQDLPMLINYNCPNNLEIIGNNNIFKEEAVAEQKKYLLELMESINYPELNIINDVLGVRIFQSEYTFHELDELLNYVLKEKNNQTEKEKTKRKCLR